MGRRGLARGSARGGEIVPSSRSTRARVAVSLAAATAAGATGTWLALGVDDRVARWANAAAAVAAVLLLAAGLALRLPLAAPLAVCVLGTGYATALALDGGPLDGRAPVVAAALFVVAELAYWSLELRDAVADEAGSYARRIALLAALSVGALAVGSALLGIVDAGGGPIVGLEVLGVIAAVAALAVVALGARQPEGD